MAFCHRWWKSHEPRKKQSIGRKSKVLTFRNVVRTLFLAFFGKCDSDVCQKEWFFEAYFGAFKHVGFAMFHSSKCGLGNLSSRGQSLE